MKKDWFQEEYGISVWALGQIAYGLLVFTQAVLIVCCCRIFHALVPRILSVVLGLYCIGFWSYCFLAFRRGGRAEQ